MAFNKSIILLITLSSLLSYYVKANDLLASLERVCQKTQKSKECVRLIKPYLKAADGYTIDNSYILQTGLEGFNDQLEKATKEAKRLKSESETPEMDDVLDQCLDNYQLLVNHIKTSLDALRAKNYSDMENELNFILKLAYDCANAFTDGKQELYKINHEELVPLAETNSEIARGLIQFGVTK